MCTHTWREKELQLMLLQYKSAPGKLVYVCGSMQCKIQADLHLNMYVYVYVCVSLSE